MFAKFLPNFTQRQWSTLAIIGLADFANAICVSLQAPFFPQEVSSWRHKQNKKHMRLARLSDNSVDYTISDDTTTSIFHYLGWLTKLRTNVTYIWMSGWWTTAREIGEKDET